MPDPGRPVLREPSVRDRRRRNVVLLWLVAVLVLLAGAGTVLLFTQVTAVSTISVRGEVNTPRGQIEAAAAPALGEPIARVRTGAIRTAALRLPWVREVTVTRSWPHTLVVTVREATAVAAVPASGPAGARLDLLDAQGERIVSVDAPQGARAGERGAGAAAEVPLVTVATPRGASAGERGAAAAAAGSVAAALPKDLRSQVATISSRSPDDVRLTLDDGTVVAWGGASRSALKAEVLDGLRSVGPPAHTIDVSAPDAPATS